MSSQIDLEAKGPDGLPLIPLDSHVRLARKDSAREYCVAVTLLRTAWTILLASSTPVSSLISFQRDPESRFVRLQRRLGQNDRLTEYTAHG